MSDAPKHFDKIAEQYDAVLPEHVQAHYRRKRVRLIGPMLAAGEGLDVGCGTGLLIEALKPYGRVTGVDGSAGMIEVLKRNGRGEAVVAPTDALPFENDRFAVVFCIAVMHHVAEPARVERTIREMARVTKPGGRVVIWDHNPANPYWPSIMSRAPQDTGEERLIPESELKTALSAAGMIDIKVVKSGFVPEFIPRWLMPVARLFEALVEHIPLLRRLAAHNVIIALKPAKGSGALGR